MSSVMTLRLVDEDDNVILEMSRLEWYDVTIDLHIARACGPLEDGSMTYMEKMSALTR